MNKIYFGHITMTHGIKGELKLYTDFSLKEKVLKIGFPIYIKGICHKISSVRPHKNCYLITIDEKKDINLVEEFRSQDVFVEISDIPLKEEEVIIETIKGYQVIENEEILGNVTDILYNKNGILLQVQGRKKFYIPYQDSFVKQIDKKESKIIVTNGKGLML